MPRLRKSGKAGAIAVLPYNRPHDRRGMQASCPSPRPPRWRTRWPHVAGNARVLANVEPRTLHGESRPFSTSAPGRSKTHAAMPERSPPCPPTLTGCRRRRLVGPLRRAGGRARQALHRLGRLRPAARRGRHRGLARARAHAGRARASSPQTTSPPSSAASRRSRAEIARRHVRSGRSTSRTCISTSSGG